LSIELAERESHQQLPEVAAVLPVVAAIAGCREKAAIGRVNHVLGIDLLLELARQPAARQGNEPVGKAAKQLRRWFRVCQLGSGHRNLRLLVRHGGTEQERMSRGVRRRWLFSTGRVVKSTSNH